MKVIQFWVVGLILLLPIHATAGDFDWAVSFNLHSTSAQFSKKMSARFGSNSSHLNLVLKSTKSHADVYIIFRLSEISGKSISTVLSLYQSHGSKGWGVLAKELGIKPGSAEFKRLKSSQDLFTISINLLPGSADKKGKKGKNK